VLRIQQIDPLVAESGYQVAESETVADHGKAILTSPINGLANQRKRSNSARRTARPNSNQRLTSHQCNLTVGNVTITVVE